MEHVKTVVTIAAPSNTHHLTQLFGDNIETIEQKGEADITLAGRRFTV